MGVHDLSYRRLFSQPRMVEELLRGFVTEPWVARLDFSRLRRVNASFVSAHLQGREGDLIWRPSTPPAGRIQRRLAAQLRK